jgi:colicin import membrane protein
MKIIIKKGEPLWNSDGFHVLDEKGFAVISEELHQEIIITNPEAIERVKKSLRRDRWDEIYVLALNSTEQFLKDKNAELEIFEEEQKKIELEKIQMSAEEVKAVFEKRQQELEAQRLVFEEQRRAEQAERDAEMARILQEQKEKDEKAIADSEAEMARLRAQTEPIIAERKAREKAEAEAAAAEKRAQEELIKQLLERIDSLEKSK